MTRISRPSGPGLVASPRIGWDAHRVPFPEFDDLVVDLHPPAPAHDHVHLLLRLVRVTVRKAIAGRAIVFTALLLALYGAIVGTRARAVSFGPSDSLKT